MRHQLKCSDFFYNNICRKAMNQFVYCYSGCNKALWCR